MGALEGFLSTWDKARQTFGSGVPQTGEQFDQSAQLEQMQSTVQTAAPGSLWTGTAANAYGAVNTEHARVLGELAALDRRLAAHVNESANVVATGRQNLDTLRQWVVDAAASVPPGKNREQLLLPIVQKGLGDLSGIVSDSNTELNRVAGNITKLGNEWDALQDQKFGGAGKEDSEDKRDDEVQLVNHEEKLEEITSASETGASDAEAMQDGQLTPEQQQRLEDNTTLTPEQQSALDNGNLQLPPEQMSYLQGFSRAFGDKTPAEIKAIMDKAGPPGGQVADAFQIASNPNITTGLPPTDPPSIENPSSGGKYALPDGIQSVLDGPAMTQPMSTGVFEDGRWIVPPEPTGPLQPTQGFNELADIIQSGNRDLQQGTALDAGLLTKSQEMLDIANQRPIPQAEGPGFGPLSDPVRWHHENVDPTLQNMFNAVNKDEMVIHDAFASDTPAVNPDGRSTFLTPEGKAFLDDITEHQWQDDGLAAGGLLDWIDGAAAEDSSGRAAATAHALAEYTSDNNDRLLNLPGADNQSLGEVNPELTRDMARAFSPYWDDMVGPSNGDSNGGFPPLDLAKDGLAPTHTRDLLSVMYSDHPPINDAPIDVNAPRTASEIAMGGVHDHMNKYFEGSAASIVDSEAGESHSRMIAAGRLQAALDLGAYDERYNAAQDTETARKEAYTLRSKAYDGAMLVTGLVPGAGPAASVGGFMKEFFISPDSVAPGVTGVATRDMQVVQMQMAESLIPAGVGNPQLREELKGLLIGGDLIAPSQDTDAFYDFQDNLGSYIHDVPAAESLIQSYWETYTGAIANAEPQK
ncbi:TPR repeat region-containing protein [Mycobacterium sp. NPDC003323]